MVGQEWEGLDKNKRNLEIGNTMKTAWAWLKVCCMDLTRCIYSAELLKRVQLILPLLSYDVKKYLSGHRIQDAGSPAILN